MINYIHYKVWGEISDPFPYFKGARDDSTYPFPNFNGSTVEIWEWINNHTPHFIMNVVTYPSCD